MSWNLYYVFYSPYTIILSICISWDVEDPFIRKSIWDNNRNQTRCFSHVHEARPLLEDMLVVLTHLLLLSCTKAYELAFSAGSILWRKVCLNLPFLSSGTFLGAGRSRNWLLESSAWKLGLPWPSFIFIIPKIVKVFDSFERSGACRRWILVWSLAFFVTLAMKCVWKYHNTHRTLF